MDTNGDHLDQDRVRQHTRPTALNDIDEKTRRNIRFYSRQSRATIDARIAELERERDMEQVLETNASLLALSGAILGTTVHRGFFAVTGTVLGFLSQHAISGWCPPVYFFRKAGIRTRTEINQERYALKVLRGDFVEAQRASGLPAAEHLHRAVAL